MAGVVAGVIVAEVVVAQAQQEGEVDGSQHLVDSQLGVEEVLIQEFIHMLHIHGFGKIFRRKARKQILGPNFPLEECQHPRNCLDLVWELGS